MTDKDKIIEFDSVSLLNEIPHFSEKGITEFTLHDVSIANDKKVLSEIVKAFVSYAPDVFLSLRVSPSVLDVNFVRVLSNLYCSLEIPLEGTVKNGNLLFDKKLYSSKAKLLNDAGVVFGFDMSFACQPGDSFKAFRDRVNFALTLYPNHIDFAQLYEKKSAKSTGIYSSKDIDFSSGLAFALSTFYSAGRAVPWFNTVIKPLKIDASTFFLDFDEWQQCNNCSMFTEFNPENTDHKDIEKMQLAFLRQKYEEKNKLDYFDAVKDMVVLNGAFSRVAFENEESVVETSYNPDDILSPYALDLQSFVENVTYESCRVKVFAGLECPDYRIL